MREETNINEIGKAMPQGNPIPELNRILLSQISLLREVNGSMSDLEEKLKTLMYLPSEKEDKIIKQTFLDPVLEERNPAYYLDHYNRCNVYIEDLNHRLQDLLKRLEV